VKRAVLSALAAALCAAAPAPSFSAESDSRQLVQMPAEARAELRAEMLDFQTALHLIVSALGEGKLADAADTAEQQIGLSAMGRHRNAPANARPGMHMPSEMHAIARGMHGAASDFAKAARAAKPGDTAKAWAALSTVTGACVACHRSYRTQ
jgi:cytochrome c556